MKFNVFHPSRADCIHEAEPFSLWEKLPNLNNLLNLNKVGTMGGFSDLSNNNGMNKTEKLDLR